MKQVIVFLVITPLTIGGAFAKDKFDPCGDDGSFEQCIASINKIIRDDYLTLPKDTLDCLSIVANIQYPSAENFACPTSEITESCVNEWRVLMGVQKKMCLTRYVD